MSGRRRQTLSPSLFPFLAVLVCTLGTLILLLALVAQNSANTAQQRAEEKKSEVAGDERGIQRLTVQRVAELISDEQFRIDTLVEARQAQTADLEERRNQLAHIDDHIRRIREKIRQLSAQVVAATEEPDTTVDEREIARLKQELEKAKKDLDKQRKNGKDKTPRVVIVPHKGPNGTQRRPIYVECTESGVTIWPEGVEVELANLEESVRGANPLDAALRVARLRALKDYGDRTAPYPMLIVRPTGVTTYAAARKAMRDWDDQFGYELVPGEVKLAYSQPDLELKKRMEYAIRQAVIEQYGLNAIAQRAFGGPPGSGTYRRRSVGAASGRVSNSSNQKLPSLSAAQMDRQGRDSGFRDHRLPNGSSYSSDFGRVGGSSEGFMAGTGADAAAKLDERLREAAEAVSGDANGSSSQGNNVGITAVDQIGNSEKSPAAPPGAPRINPFGSPNAKRSDNNSDERIASTDSSLGSLTGSPGTLNGPANRKNASSNHLDSNSQTQANANQRAKPSQQGNANKQASANAPGQSGASPSSNSVPSSSSQASQVRPPQSANVPSVPKLNSASAELVRRGGANWALPRELALSRGNSVVRTIRVKCYPNYFVLMPSSRTGGKERVFEFDDGEINRATLELATAVRDRIKTWGAALPGGRWQPRLAVEVMPRGDQRFHQLRMLMSGSGVDVERSKP